MADAHRFSAPWGTMLQLSTAMSVLLLACLPLVGLFAGPRSGAAVVFTWYLSMVVAPLLVLFIGVFFVIRGYVLTPRVLRVQRLGWESRVPLAGLRAAEVSADAMRRSIRLFGNGGLFCFAGLFRNKSLGRYRAFATDPKRSVVLRFEDRIVVVTPGEPAAFVAALPRLRVLA